MGDQGDGGGDVHFSTWGHSRKQVSRLPILVRKMFNIAPVNAAVTVRSTASKQHRYMPAMQEF